MRGISSELGTQSYFGLGRAAPQIDSKAQNGLLFWAESRAYSQTNNPTQKNTRAQVRTAKLVLCVRTNLQRKLVSQMPLTHSHEV